MVSLRLLSSLLGYEPDPGLSALACDAWSERIESSSDPAGEFRAFLAWFRRLDERTSLASQPPPDAAGRVEMVEPLLKVRRSRGVPLFALAHVFALVKLFTT